MTVTDGIGETPCSLELMF